MMRRQRQRYGSTFAVFGMLWLAPVGLALVGLAPVVLAPAVLAPGVASAASLLPLATEQAQTLPSGMAEATIGLAYFNDGRFPGFVPPGALRRQTLIEGPQLGFNIGIGDWAEFQASYETIYLDEQAANGQTNTQFGSGDARFFTKFRFARETEHFPGLGMRFGTKLPDATRGSRLGTDDTDFGADVLLSKDFGPLAAHLNLGILLLGNSGSTIGQTFTAGGQDDLFDYNLAVVSKPLGAGTTGATMLRLVAELTGLAGSRYGNDRTAMRFGLQLNRGAGTMYLGTSAGLVTASENIGASAGFIYTFDPASLFDGD
jgi:hypothetical protein